MSATKAYHATREHRAALERHLHDYEWGRWQPYCLDDVGGCHDMPAVMALDEEDARADIRYHYSDHPAPWIREWYVRWQQAGEPLKKMVGERRYR